MAMQSLNELFVDKLKDIYDAERRITKALPKMIKTAASEELSTAFEEHLRVTENQIERLDRIFENIGESPGRKTCHGMMGIIEEGQELMEKDAPEAVMDAGLIAAAQEVEHYEISSYGCLKTWADQLGMSDESGQLEESLNGEKEADERLNQLATQINLQAMEMGGEDDEETENEGTESTDRPMQAVGTSRGSTRGRGSNGGSRGGPRSPRSRKS